MTINGSRFVLPKNTLALMPGKIKVIVGDPIDPGEFKGKGEEALLEAVRTAIEKNQDLSYGDLTL